MKIARINPGHLSGLKRFFSEISHSETTTYFNPHPFTAQYAQYLCSYQGKDEYYVMEADGVVVGYGMLRGWDEGYSRPSLGVCISANYSGRGYGTEMVRHLISVAKSRKASEIILSVEESNRTAIQLYNKTGFVLEPLTLGRLRGKYRFPEFSDLEVTILLAAWEEGPNLAILLPQLNTLFRGASAKFEIFVVDGGSKDNTRQLCEDHGCRIETQTKPGYANAIIQGIRNSLGKHIIVLDADGSHAPEDALRLYHHRSRADIVINSRYIPQGGSQGPWSRRLLSQILNFVYRNFLGLPLKEISGGFRIYRREIFGPDFGSNSNFYEIQEELLAVPFWKGYTALEIPYQYRLRIEGQSKASLLRFGFHLMLGLFNLRKMKKAILTEQKNKTRQTDQRDKRSTAA